MPHRVHLCLLSSDDLTRVAVCQHGPHWLWPTMEFTGRTRLPLAATQRLTRGLGRCTPCCVTYPCAASARYVEWLGVYGVAPTSALSAVAWVPLATLTEQRAVVPYQGRALRWYRAGLDGTRRAGPFESPHALDTVRAWVTKQLGSHRTLVDGQTAYRLTADEAVIGFETVRGYVYFKAQGTRPFRDALVSQLLARMRPGAVAETLAWDEARGWWLQDQVDSLCVESQWDVSTAWRVIDTIADLQSRLRRATSDLAAAGAIQLTTDLFDVQLHDLLQRIPARASGLAHALVDAFEQTHAVLDADPDRTWNHNDLAGQNIGVSPTQVTLIDHEVAAIGPAFLSIPKLAETCRAATGTHADWFRVCAERLQPHAAPGSVIAGRRAWTMAAAVCLFVIQTTHLRRYEQGGECASTLDPLVLHAAEQLVQRLRDHRAP